jgi:hypothetical protein
MVLDFILFVATIGLVACGIISGLYLLCRHTRQTREKRVAKKLLMSDLK